MCYSAQVYEGFKKYVRLHGADIDIHQYVKLYVDRRNGLKVKTPKAIDEWVAAESAKIAVELEDWKRAEAQRLEPELFEQVKRVADNERKLLTKVTKTAQEEVRKGSNNVRQIRGWLDDFKRKEILPRDNRFFPQWYAPVIVVEDGKWVVKPMRYQCRIPGMPASSDYTKDGKLSGTYNARRDNLGRFWRKQFGYTHGLMVISTFYENVDRPGGGSVRIQFTPKDNSPMLVACLWAHWTDPEGVEPDLLSFAAITDEPEPEVAAAGHDRTIINIKPEHVDAWLNPDPANLQALYDIFDDKQHPYYEHRLEKAA